MGIVEFAVVMLVALVVAGGICVWYTVVTEREDEGSSLGQNDLEKSSTER